jgi:hypothetical protein
MRAHIEPHRMAVPGRTEMLRLRRAPIRRAFVATG